MALTDTQKKLLDRRIIDVSGDVNFDMMKYVREALLLLYLEGSPTVTILISSNGGQAQAGRDIYDMIRSYSGKTIGYVFTFAGSAAAWILQACSWRVSTPSGRVLIHHVTLDNVPLKVFQDEKAREEFIAPKRHFLKGYEELAKRVKRNLDEIIATCDDDQWMPAQAALEYGLLDQIVSKMEEVKLPDEPAT